MSHPLVPTSGYCAPQDIHFIPLTSYQQQTNQQQYHLMPYTHRMSSENAGELEGGKVKLNDWQIVKNNKRRRINTSQADIPHTEVTLSNRFDPLPMKESDSQTDPGHRTRKPPPIFIYGVVNYNEMVNMLTEVIQQEEYSTKSMAENNIKIDCTTPETYRKLLRFLKDNDIVHHTYQLNEERAFRVVIKYLHH
jgi:hypothetical protein